MAPGPKKRGRQNQRSESSANTKQSQRSENVANTKVSHNLQNNRNENKEDLNEWPDLSNPCRSYKEQQNAKSERDITKDTTEISNSVNLQNYTNGDSQHEFSQEQTNLYRGKYSKRAVTKNWDKYDKEPEVDNEERGADFETLLSYSGGSGTQFRLLGEKDWDESISETDKNDFLSLDCNALSSALQCIPLHKRLNLPEEVFTPEIISRFQRAAEQYYRQYKPILNKTGYNELNSPDFQSESKISVSSQCKDLMDAYNKSDHKQYSIDKTTVHKKYSFDKTTDREQYFSDKTADHKQYSPDRTTSVTENLIESLTSCLSLKEVNDLPPSEVTPMTSKEKLTETLTKDKPFIADGDLDFLLSLSVPSTKLSLPSCEKNAETAAKKKSIDEWLDSVLED